MSCGFTALEHRLEELAVVMRQKHGLLGEMHKCIEVQSSKVTDTVSPFTETYPDDYKWLCRNLA